MLDQVQFGYVRLFTSSSLGGLNVDRICSGFFTLVLLPFLDHMILQILQICLHVGLIAELPTLHHRLYLLQSIKYSVKYGTVRIPSVAAAGIVRGGIVPQQLRCGYPFSRSLAQARRYHKFVPGYLLSFRQSANLYFAYFVGYSVIRYFANIPGSPVR